MVLAWTVPVAGSSFSPTQAAAALAAVDLYANQVTDPVLAQFFCLNVASDVTANDATSATRTLTLQMVGVEILFPCHPRTSTPPEPPYPLVAARTLPGSFFVTLGLATVDTTDSQIPSLNVGDEIQFLNQQGVVYEVLSIDSAIQITLTTAFTGTTGNTGAFKEVSTPKTLLAIYSSSELDTNGVANTDPAIPAGSGARTVEFTYEDSTGAPFTVTVELTGKRPAPIVLDPASLDVASILEVEIATAGAFEVNVGQLTIAGLSAEIPDVPPDTPIGTGIGIIEGAAPTVYGNRTFKDLTDEAMMLIEEHLAYVPPSYSSLVQQQLSFPALEGDFIVTTGSRDVPTTEDHTGGGINDGDFIEFAVQPGTRYEVESVTASIVRLVTVFSGIDTNNTGLNNTPMNNSAQTKGNIGKALNRKATGARLLEPSVSGAPVDDEFSIPFGQHTETQVAAPPPGPPFPPATVPTPTFLSNYFTNTIQVALAGVSITPATITFLP